MEEVIRIFNQIQNTSSLNEKKAIITANKENELFRECLKFLLDGNITTGIAEKKYDSVCVKTSDWKHENLREEFLQLLDYIKQHNTGREEDIIQVQAWCCSTNDELKDFVKGMITKSIKLGADAKLVNKCIPDLIPTWEVQLGSAYDKLKLKDGEWFALSRKLNGNRGSFYQGRLISRQGKEFTGMQHIISDLEQLTHNMFYDGELIRKNVDNLSDGENFRIGTGIINSDAESKTEIKFVIFDAFAERDLPDKQSKERYRFRRKILNSLRQLIAEKNLQNVEIVEMVYEGTEQSQIMKWLDYAVAHDWEGLMLNKDAAYKCKRTTDLIKIKRFYSMDLPIIDVLEGDGRLKGTLGALVVQYKNNTVNVGSGFDDETRRKFWAEKDALIGQIAEVKYKEVTKDKKTGLESLQFPIYIGLREKDKCVSYD